MLGHSSIAITLDTYSHVLPNMQQSAVRALDEVLK
jgi:integrase